MNDQKIKLNLQEAYVAMYKFLEHEYEMTGSDEIGGMLGSMSLLEDGGTADPAAWSDWIQADENAIGGNEDIKLHVTHKTDA
jgi:hypothetical protein